MANIIKFGGGGGDNDVVLPAYMIFPYFSYASETNGDNATDNAIHVSTYFFEDGTRTIQIIPDPGLYGDRIFENDFVKINFKYPRKPHRSEVYIKETGTYSVYFGYYKAKEKETITSGTTLIEEDYTGASSAQTPEVWCIVIKW